MNPMRGMLETAIPLAVANHIAGIIDSNRQGSRAPQFVRFIVPQIKYFAGRIADRIVRPGRQLVLAAVKAPGAATAQLRDRKTEFGIGDHVDPGCRCPLALVEHDHVFASVVGKPAEPVEEFERR